MVGIRPLPLEAKKIVGVAAYDQSVEKETASIAHVSSLSALSKGLLLREPYEFENFGTRSECYILLIVLKLSHSYGNSYAVYIYIYLYKHMYTWRYSVKYSQLLAYQGGSNIVFLHYAGWSLNWNFSKSLWSDLSSDLVVSGPMLKLQCVSTSVDAQQVGGNCPTEN